MKNQELTNVNTEKTQKEFEVAKSVKMLLQLQQENLYKRFPDLEKEMGNYTVKIIVTY